MHQAYSNLPPQLINGFDYTTAVWRVANNICENVSLVAHVDMNLVAVDYVRCRNEDDHGTLATMTPLRENAAVQIPNAAGHLQHTETDGRQQSFPANSFAVDTSGKKVVYLLTVFLPRFSNLNYREKLVTIAHELWHIGEECDGLLRRFPGRFSVHGKSEKAFDAKAKSIVDRWLRTNPPDDLTRFLAVSLTELVDEHGTVFGQRFSKP